VILHLEAGGAVVRDADDCTRLHLETDLDAAALRTALRATGSGDVADEGNAWVDLAVLRSRAALLATTPDWAERWSAMTAYAERKGWLSGDGLSVQVHVERPSGKV
jgi:hypothetical protein